MGRFYANNVRQSIASARPAGVVRLRAEVAHCEARRGRGGELVGYLVGVRIREITDDDHGRLIEYIEERS